ETMPCSTSCRLISRTISRLIFWKRRSCCSVRSSRDSISLTLGTTFIIDGPEVFPLSCLRFHIATQNGIDAGLITLLLPKPFEKIGIQADRDGFLRFWHHHARAFPEIPIGRLDLGIGLNGPPDLSIRQSPNPFPF